VLKNNFQLPEKNGKIHIYKKKFANSLIYSNLPVIVNEKEKESKENRVKYTGGSQNCSIMSSRSLNS